MDRDSNPSAAWPRTVARAVALALLCGALQALLPRYTLGAVMVGPLSVVLGVTVAAVLTRGASMIPAALAGVLGADQLGATPLAASAADVVLLGVQAWVAGRLMRTDRDPDLLLLDNGPRLRRLVLVAAPSAALLGAAGMMLAQWAIDATLPVARPMLAGAAGRLVADWSGIVVTAPVLMCWLARPHGPWRPRRRLVAMPLVLLAAVMLPGFEQLARRDELRQQLRFERDASARQQRLQQLLSEPVDALLALRGMLAAGGDNLSTALFDRLAAGWTERLGGLSAVGWFDVAATPGRPAAAAGVELGHAQVPPSGSLAALGTRQRDSFTPSTAVAAAVDRSLASDDTALVQPVGPFGGQMLMLQALPEAGTVASKRRVAFALVDLQRRFDVALPDDDDPNLRICVFDGKSAANQPLQRLAGSRACADRAVAGAVRVQAGVLSLAGRRLDLLVIEPPTADNRLFTAVWLLALPAVSGAAMLATLLLALSGRIRRVEDRVRERTAALQAENDERRQAESALAHSEQRFRAIFDNVTVGVTLVDRQGRITMANPAFCKMMGCSANDLLQRPLAEYRLPDVAEDDGVAAALGGSDARRQRFLTVDGRVLQVAASLRPLVDAGGQPVGTVGVMQDLTPVLRLRQVEREREQADVANRTKSDFLARLSHELRAPLNAIIGFTQRLGGAGDGDASTRQRTLAQIRQAGWHLQDMINDVLDLSRMEAGSLRLQLEPVALTELTQQALAMVEPAAQQAGVTVSLSLSPQAAWVQADPVRLRQVLVNLLGNAVKYNRSGGRVELRTRPAGVGEVLIDVEDTGIGIGQAQMSELFTPFHRLGRERGAVPGSPQEQGTGIGLVICRRLVALMAGELSVSSEEGTGSVFSLRLPAPLGPPQRTEVNGGAPLTSRVTIGRVLCIEDDEQDLALLGSAMAQRPGVTLVVAHTAAAGLAQAAEADLLLLDLDLPDRPGIDLLRSLKADARLRDIPVIVVSAETRPKRIDECFDAGAAQFLTKPLDEKTLLRAIDDGLATV